MLRAPVEREAAPTGDILSLASPLAAFTRLERGL